MNKFEWVEQIKNDCEGIGTYRPEFDSVIDTLATILEQRDKVFDLYEQDGGNPVIIGEGSTGQQTRKRNPLLLQWQDLNKDAALYWKELGLTPSGLKKITDGNIVKKNTTSMLDEFRALKEEMKNG